MGIPHDCKDCHRRDTISLCYGTEAVNPAEIGLPTYSVENFDGGFNSERLRESLELIDEKRDHALIVPLPHL